MRRLLFVCTANQNRSKTAEDLYRGDPRYEVRSAGTYLLEDSSEGRPVTQELADWADFIFVMEDRHSEELQERFTGCAKKIVVLGVPDDYFRGDPALVDLLRRRLAAHLG